MKRIVISTLALSLVGLVGIAKAEGLMAEASPTSMPSCTKISKSEVAALFDRWNASLKTHNPEKVAENYAPDAVLLATVSNKPRVNHDEIKDYFVDFLQKDPQGKIDTSTIKIGCNTALDVGTYTFTLKGGKKVAARYSFAYEYEDGKWLIEHHHSSAMPEK